MGAEVTGIEVNRQAGGARLLHEAPRGLGKGDSPDRHAKIDVRVGREIRQRPGEGEETTVVDVVTGGLHHGVDIRVVLPVDLDGLGILQSISCMFSCILSLMQEVNQSTGYQKVAKPKTKDIVFDLAVISICC